MEIILKKSFSEIKEFFTEETKKHSLFRFLLLILVLAGYYLYASQKFGAKGGAAITILTWSFFVLSTPIADAGFVLAFPIRLVFGVRMVKTQIIAYFFAIAANIIALAYFPYIYGKTLILALSKQIITKPFPYWGIIIISALGTFFSIYFGDELMDISTKKDAKKYHKHFNKYRIIVFLFIVFFTIILYKFLISSLNIAVPLI